MERTHNSPSVTAERILEISHTWTIENFGFFLYDEAIESPAFGAQSDPNTLWRLSLCPNANDDDDGDHCEYMSFDLTMLSSSQSNEVPACAVIHVQGSNGRSLKKAFRRARHFSLNPSRQTTGWYKFARREKVLREYVSDDKLVIRCELSHKTKVDNIDATRNSPNEATAAIQRDSAIALRSLSQDLVRYERPS